MPGAGSCFIGRCAAERATEYETPCDVVIVGSPDRDDATEAAASALRAIGHDAQVIFRSPAAWRDARDAFTRTAKASPLVELDLGQLT